MNVETISVTHVSTLPAQLSPVAANLIPACCEMSVVNVYMELHFWEDEGRSGTSSILDTQASCLAF